MSKGHVPQVGSGTRHFGVTLPLAGIGGGARARAAKLIPVLPARMRGWGCGVRSGCSLSARSVVKNPVAIGHFLPCARESVSLFLSYFPFPVS